MKAIWATFRQPQNPAIVVALAGGFGFLWEEVIRPKLNKKAEPPAAAFSQQASASGGAAVNARGRAQVSIGPGAATPAPAGMSASMPSLAASQSAQAAVA